MGDFERPCLVDIDTQVDYVQPSGAIAVPGAADLIPAWKEITNFGEANKLPMLAAVDCHPPDDPEFGEFGAHCVQNTPGQVKVGETLASRYQLVPNDPREQTIDLDVQVILEKQTIDVFSNVHAEEIFSTVLCSTFAVYGVITEYAVRAAVLGLLARGHRVHVLSDAIAAINPSAGERALAEMANAGATFLQTSAFLDKVRQHLVNRAL